MKNNIYNAPGFVDTWHEQDKGIIVAKWHKLTTREHVRPSCEEQLKVAQTTNAKCVIVDTSTAEGVPFPEDQKWFGDYLFPNMQKAGIKAIITVLPQNALTRLGTNTWKKTGSLFDMDFVDAASYEDAVDIASKY